MGNLVNLIYQNCPTEDDPRDVADLAGLPTEHIVFSGPGFSVWLSLLREARRLGKLDDVVRVVIEDYYGPEDELEEAKKRYLANGIHTAGVADDRDRIKLRSRRPGRDLPSDFQSGLFVDTRLPDRSPAPIVDLIGVFQEVETAMACCLVAHYQMDIEFSLLEVEESVALSEHTEAENYQTIWIRGDELWRSPVVATSEQSARADWAVLRPLRPSGVDLSLFQDEFERLLDESALLFIFDFSRLSIEDIKGLSDPHQEERRDAVMDSINAFIRNATGRGQRIMVGLPRLALALPGWRNFVDFVSTCFFACELFDLPSLAKFSDDSCGLLPPVMAEALGPLMGSNSYALRQRLKKEIQSLAIDQTIRSAGTARQLREVLAIASRLTSEGFLEPAYRLETWYRTCAAGRNRIVAGADIIPSPDDVSGIFGEVGSIYDLPRAADRAIVTGESGQGKTAALRQIEAKWALPNRKQSGRRHPAWLPIYLENLHQPSSDIAEYFRQQSSAPSPEGIGTNLILQAHAQLGRIDLGDNLGWLFGSSILYLVDGLRDSSDEGQIARWVNSLLATSHLKTGLITSYRDSSEAPFDRPWFRRAFQSALEARLKPLDEAQALSLCPDSARQQLVKTLLGCIDQPLSRYVRIPFLTQCLCSIKELKQIPDKCSLLELLELYILSKCDHERSERLGELVRHHLPFLARSLYYGENPVIPEEAVRVAIRYYFIASGSPVTFEHKILQDYFLAKYLCSTWKEAGPQFLESLLSVPSPQWQTRYLNLLRMVMKGLAPSERSGLVEFLQGEKQEQLAHRCLLELRPDEYHAVSAAHAISTSLITTLGQTDEHEGVEETRRVLKTKLRIAESLGCYDPRIPAVEDTLSAFVPVPVVENIKLLIGRYLVTNLEFFRFMKDGGYLDERFWHAAGWEWRKKNDVRSPAYWTNFELSRPNYPVIGVSFHEALAYARWLTEMAGGRSEKALVFSLPTDTEWSLASGFGTLMTDLIKNRSANHQTSGSNGTPSESEILEGITYEQMVDLISDRGHHSEVTGGTAVGLFRPTEHGVYDLFNCVWQWCDGWFALTGSDIVPSSNHQHVSAPVLVRGGPATSNARGLVSLIGGGLDPSSRVDNVGFRLICRQMPQQIKTAA